MRTDTCCFTGHRIIPIDEYESIRQKILYEATSLINCGVVNFCAGGALGFDTLAAETVLELKRNYEGVRLILILPCVDQDKRWSEKDKKRYASIKNGADEIIYTSKEYYNGCMQVRNRRLVEESGVCICYLKEKFGGTRNTVGYAKKNGLKIINVAE